MRNSRYQRVVSIAVGLWFTVLTHSSPAQEVRIPAQSKALAQYIMAIVEELNGNDQPAMRAYEQAVKLDQKQPLSRLRLSAYYMRLGRIQEAIAQLKTAIKLQPDLSQARYLLALIYSSQKKYHLAVDQYELILKLVLQDNPQNMDVHSYLAQLYFALGQYSQAQEQLSWILKYQPKNVSALYLEGNVFLESNQPEQAKENFRKILSVEPQHDGALNSLAYVYATDGINLDEALRMARKAVDLDPSNGAYYDTLGWVLFKKGFNAESLIALDKAQGYTTDPLIYEHMGDVYQAAHEPTLARKFWLKSLALSPKQIQVSQKLEQLNKTSARHQGVEDHLTK